MTVVCGWMVRHQSTDLYTNGDVAAPKIPMAAASFSDPGPPYFLTIRYPRNTSTSIVAIVTRASHCHHTPHALRPQSDPLNNPNRPKMTTSSADATAYQSASFEPMNRYTRLATPQTAIAAVIAIHVAKWK